MKNLIAIILLLLAFKCHSKTILVTINHTLDSIPKRTPCNIETLKKIDQNLNSLTESGIIEFLGTFSDMCDNNVEFSEWSNELLFKVIRKNVTLYMKAFHTRGLANIEAVMKEIENPLYDFDLQSFYNLIKTTNGYASKDLVDYHLQAIKLAAKSEGVNLIE